MVIWTKISGVRKWINTLVYLFSNRGLNTYGAETIKKIVEKHIYEYSKSRQDYEAAEAIINDTLSFFMPKRISGLARIGPSHDAGYVGILEPLPDILISGGAGKNIDFEHQLASLGVIVHVFDHTVRKLPLHSKNLHHHRSALASSSTQLPGSLTLGQCINRANTTDNCSKWLKLDIEGFEWKLISEDLELLTGFSQIFIEFHDLYKLSDSAFRKNYLEIFTFLSKNFNLIAISSNNWQGVCNFGMSFIPNTFEVTYLNKSMGSKAKNNENFRDLCSVNNRYRLAIPESPFRVANLESGSAQQGMSSILSQSGD